MTYQKVTIVGNCGKTPEMRYLPNGTAVTNFSMATNNEYTNSNSERVKETTWFRVSCWGKLAEIVNQYMSQGGKDV